MHPFNKIIAARLWTTKRTCSKVKGWLVPAQTRRRLLKTSFWTLTRMKTMMKMISQSNIDINLSLEYLN